MRGRMMRPRTVPIGAFAFALALAVASVLTVTRDELDTRKAQELVDAVEAGAYFRNHEAIAALRELGNRAEAMDELANEEPGNRAVA